MPDTSYPNEPEFDNTVGNPETGYKPNPDDSIYKNKLTITEVVPLYADGDDPGAEYVAIYASDTNTEKIPLTGMKLKSMITGTEYSIGGAASLFYQNTVNAQTGVFLNPGDTAFVITGRSPVGSSFRSNMCTGYLQQFQQFTPALSLSCPLIYYEGLPERPNTLPDECLLYVSRFPQCIAPTTNHEQGITELYGRDCFLYIQKTANYNYCINKHRGEPAFYEPVWHIYLNRDNHIWRLKREWVRLLDQNNKNGSEYSYIYLQVSL